MDNKSNNDKILADQSSNVKINFNEMDKNDLLQVLVFMQSEIEAREMVISSLKSDKSNNMIYGRFNITQNRDTYSTQSSVLIDDAFAALQRDNQFCTNSSNNNQNTNNNNTSSFTDSPLLSTDHNKPVDSSLKPVYDNQLCQLENLISSQRKAQMKMKEQILFLEKRCQKLSQALEDERNKHERDAAQGDDVLVMLEKERERLKSELEFERSQNRKLERELKKVTNQLDEQKLIIQNQRLAAATLILQMKTQTRQCQLQHQTKETMDNQTETIPISVTDLSSASVNDTGETGETGNLPAEITDDADDSPDKTPDKSIRNNDSNTNRSSPHNINNIPVTNSNLSEGSVIQPINNNSPLLTGKQQSAPVSRIIPPSNSTTQSKSSPTSDQPTKSTQPSQTNHKSPESLQWKTYDPKQNRPSNHSHVNIPVVIASNTNATHSPSNNRRQLPSTTTVSPSISSSSSVSQSAPTQTPYQKILSTPPPNHQPHHHIHHNPLSRHHHHPPTHNPTASYGLLNLHPINSPNPTPHSSLHHNIPYLYTQKSSQNISNSSNTNTNSIIIRPTTLSSSNPSSIDPTNNKSSNPPATSNTNPTIAHKHIYVNGK